MLTYISLPLFIISIIIISRKNCMCLSMIQTETCKTCKIVTKKIITQKNILLVTPIGRVKLLPTIQRSIKEWVNYNCEVIYEYLCSSSRLSLEATSHTSNSCSTLTRRRKWASSSYDNHTCIYKSSKDIQRVSYTKGLKQFQKKRDNYGSGWDLTREI